MRFIAVKNDLQMEVFDAGTNHLYMDIKSQPPMFDCREVNDFSYQSQLLADLFKT